MNEDLSKFTPDQIYIFECFQIFLTAYAIQRTMSPYRHHTIYPFYLYKNLGISIIDISKEIKTNSTRAYTKCWKGEKLLKKATEKNKHVFGHSGAKKLIDAFSILNLENEILFQDLIKEFETKTAEFIHLKQEIIDIIKYIPYEKLKSFQMEIQKEVHIRNIDS